MINLPRKYNNYKHYMLNNKAPKFMKRQCLELMGGKVDSIIIIEAFHTAFEKNDRIPKQKIKEIEDLNKSNKLDQIDRGRTLHPTAAEYTIASAHGTFSSIVHVMCMCDQL